MTQLLLFIYFVMLFGIAGFGILGLFTVYQYWKHRNDRIECSPVLNDNDLPMVTVQLPIFNERYVVDRLIKSAVELDYPKHKLEIQVVDDSTDDTVEYVKELVEHYRLKGINIVHIHRTNRKGYKAGALAEAMTEAMGEFITIFDADFVPETDFLQRTIPFFLENDKLGIIQARWEHLNANSSILTRAQAIAIDKHFVMEQSTRHRADLFPKFNGSAGIWRRSCLNDSGGWLDDTVCEDLCLSTRAILRGWEYCFLNDVTAPAELPSTISAFKSQQARWAKGSMQCLKKFFWEIYKNKENRPIARIYALSAMGSYFMNLLVLGLLLIQLPMIIFDVHLPLYAWLFTLVGFGQPILFIFGQQRIHKNWLQRLIYFPALLAIAIGITANQCRAILQVLFAEDLQLNHVFVRTPKGKEQAKRYHAPFDWIILIEGMLTTYAGISLFVAIASGRYSSILLLTMCTIGYGYVFTLGMQEQITYYRNRKKWLNNGTKSVPTPN